MQNTHRFSFCSRFYRCFWPFLHCFISKKKVLIQFKTAFRAMFHVKHLQFYQSKRYLFAIRQTLIVRDAIMYSTCLQYHYVLSCSFYTLFHVKQRFNLMFRLVFSYFRCIFIEKRASKSMFHVKHYEYYRSNKTRATQNCNKKNSPQPPAPHSCRFFYSFMSINSLVMQIGKGLARTRNRALFIFRRIKYVILALFYPYFSLFLPSVPTSISTWSDNRPFGCRSKQPVCFT